MKKIGACNVKAQKKTIFSVLPAVVGGFHVSEKFLFIATSKFSEPRIRALHDGGGLIKRRRRTLKLEHFKRHFV